MINRYNYFSDTTKILCDIGEHLPTLKRYAEQCEHITEMGMRFGASTSAFMLANPKTFISYDIDLDRQLVIDCNDYAKKNGIDFRFIQQDVLTVEIEETDLLFIDTLHNYEQLKEELSLHGNKSRKYLIFHDTVSFGHSNETGVGIGLVPAIKEFVELNPHWQIKEMFYNNNGLLILERNV